MFYTFCCKHEGLVVNMHDKFINMALNILSFSHLWRVTLSVTTLIARIKEGFTLKLINSVHRLFLVASSSINKRVGMYLWLKFCQVQHYHWMDLHCKTLFIGMFVFENGKLLQNFAHRPFSHSFFSPSHYFSLCLCLWTSHFPHPVVLCYQFRGRNRLSPRSRNQFVSAHQVSLWKCQCWKHTWYSQNEIMGHHKFCGEALSVSLMFREISTR